MAGVLAWGWYVTDEEWLPIVVDSEGRVRTVAEIDHLNDIGDVNIPAPGDEEFVFWDDPNSEYAARVLVTADMPSGVPTGEGARVYNSAAISIPHNTETTLTFDSERWDTDTIHSTTVNTHRLVAKTAGKYLVNGQVFFEANATGLRYVKISQSIVGDLASQYHSIVGAVVVGIIVTTIADMAVGEYVSLLVYQNSGGALDILQIAGLSPEFMMQRIG